MTHSKFAASLLLLVLLLTSICACGEKQPEHIDYASQVKLDMNSDTLKREVTVKTYIDGDTTHFYCRDEQFEDGFVKARYLAINTPESTGRIEEWGQKASDFTNEKLESATSIIIESDNDTWNADSTGSRYLVWVWYKTAEMTDYRNLNIEILQNGLAIASNSANNRYGTYCMAAIKQAQREMLYVHSEEKDPDYFYGEAIEITLKELRCNISDYESKKVAFEGIITKDDSGSIYLEEYDPENGICFGMAVYYQTAGLPGKALKILSVGNRVRIVGTVTEFHGAWQVSGLTYSLMNPDDPNNLQLISEGNSPLYTCIEPTTFTNGKLTVICGDTPKEFDFANLTLNTSVEMRELTVKSIYTTSSGDSKGAMTITCEAHDGTQISVRTTVLYDSEGAVVRSSYFEGKTIDVKGLVDINTYDDANEYQIKVFSLGDVIVYP